MAAKDETGPLLQAMQTSSWVAAQSLPIQ